MTDQVAAADPSSLTGNQRGILLLPIGPMHNDGLTRKAVRAQMSVFAAREGITIPQELEEDVLLASGEASVNCSRHGRDVAICSKFSRDGNVLVQEIVAISHQRCRAPILEALHRARTVELGDLPVNGMGWILILAFADVSLEGKFLRLRYKTRLFTN